MLLIEIILTIIAFNRGWRWYSVLPGVGGFCLGFGIGFCIGFLDLDASGINFIFLDVIVVIILLYMCIVPPKKDVSPSAWPVP